MGSIEYSRRVLHDRRIWEGDNLLNAPLELFSFEENAPPTPGANYADIRSCSRNRPCD